MLPPNVAIDRANAHEVEPAPDREAGDVHLVEVARTILVLPIGVVARVSEPFGHQFAVVFGDAGDLVHPLEPLGPRDATDAIALVVEAQARIDHVLRGQMRRLRDGQKVLSEPGLRTSKRSDLSRGPRLRGKPLDQVIAILQLAPAQRAVSAPHPLRLLRPTKIGQHRYVTALRQLRERLLSPRIISVGIPLLKQHRPRPLSRRRVEER